MSGDNIWFGDGEIVNMYVWFGINGIVNMYVIWDNNIVIIGVHVVR